MQVKNSMAAQVVSAKSSDTVADIARMMSEIDSGAIPVIDDGDVVGIITDRHIVIRVVAEGKLSSTPVSKVMTADIESCLEDDDLAEDDWV